ncbi:MAG: anaerobic ribonucleoside-triphosphate reductase activating protein [Paludibacteraceae bacterium]|nr:anaerobic ribonucleoside-triphosphate reductase activating protein [Paludibacteraceae bacterium]
MLKYTDYDIVFQEIPDETTLAINLSLCPNRCIGCHSPQLWEDIGQVLTENEIEKLLDKYGSAITCVSLMGGDNDTQAVNQLAEYIHNRSKRTAWYSGKTEISKDIDLKNFDYIKIGPYIEKYGGLDKPTTNQRLYKIENQELQDITYKMHKHTGIS